MALRITKKNMNTIKEALSCPDCLADPEVACARNPDAQCLLCGKCYCGLHIAPHLQSVHIVSTTWRGFLKK